MISAVCRTAGEELGSNRATHERWIGDQVHRAIDGDLRDSVRTIDPAKGLEALPLLRLLIETFACRVVRMRVLVRRDPSPRLLGPAREPPSGTGRIQD